jgi:Domain of unknown function (DUF4132)
MAVQEASLSASDHAALADGFRPLEAVNPGLPDRLVRYVTEGDDESVLSALASTPNAAALLGMDFSYAGLPPPSRQTPLPAWDALLQHHAEVPVLVLLRLAKVMSSALGPGNLIVYPSGRAVIYPGASALGSLSAPPWLELIVRLGARPDYSQGTFAVFKNRLSAEVIERMLQADGYSPEILYSRTFPTERYDFEWMNVVSLVGGLTGLGERIAARPKLVTDALRDSSAVKRALAVETLGRFSIPVVPFLDDLTRLATGPAKTLREAASASIVRAGEAALHVLRQIAESGKPDEKGHALRLIARLDLPAGKAFLHQRIAQEAAPGVLKVLKELASDEGPATTTPSEPLSDADILAGVALGAETRAALAAWAKNVAAADLDEAFTWLTQPTPWTGDPRPILGRAANGDEEGLKVLLQRPELTPLHVVRLLRLAGLLQAMPAAITLNKLDPRIPRELLEGLFGAYRNSHQPRMGLRELAAAFRASALDDELVAWARLGDNWGRRFEWEDEATWPYFADRLDWLARALDAPGSPSALARAYGGIDRRAAALALLAVFPEPPARFLPRLWEHALSTSKVHRPLAQKVLEKHPDCRERLFETLASRDSQARKTVAEWIARLKPEGAADALSAALESEKSKPVKAILAGALEALGAGAKSGNKPQAAKTKDSKEALRGEAAIGLKKGIPEKHAWFPFDRLPPARWADDDTPVERDVLNWLVVSAWKTKSAEPTVLLRGQVKLVREDDARRLGTFVLEAWLAEDLRPPTHAELLKRLENPLRWTGAATIDEIAQKRPDLAPMVEFEKNRPMSVRAEDKGILALAAACGPTDVVDRIRSYVNQWYGYRAAQCRALIQVLAWIDHPEAVAFLLDVARRFRTATIRQEAEIQARKLAERKGTTLADLAEQSLPDAGFDAEGKLILDFGPRQFIARLDDDAELILENQAGSEIDALPAPGKSDNAELAAAAKKRLTEVKKELKAVRKRVVERLYEAMCTQRSWKFADWERTLLGHPIAGRLCCRVIWTLKEGTGPASTFRPLEDGTLTDLDDNEVQPAADATVKIAHWLKLTYHTGARWAVHIADFGIDPLLPQLARSVFRLPKESRSATEWPLPLAQPQAVPPLTRRARGLGYDPAAFRLQDGGDHFIKHFPAAGLRAEIRITDFDDKENATRLDLSFRAAGTGKDSGSSMRLVPFGEIPPVLLSECHADLLSLGGGVANPHNDEDENGDE